MTRKNKRQSINSTNMIRKYKRIVAVFLLLNFLVSILQPTVSWALTAGPTAPEATSFEPVDTTDMVNLITGDFTYNIPLLEVPGPSGSYPLSLSYHAGIQPNEEASWVGLGWNLQPGAINRNTNGFPDDFENVINSERTFWEGGNTKTFSIGINMGAAGFAGVTAGLTISSDTYRGFGVGVGLTYGAGIGLGPASLKIQQSGGIDPYGNTYSTTGITVGLGMATRYGMSGGLSAGILSDNTTGKVSSSVSAGANFSFSGLDASISTNSKPSFSAGGFSGSIYNSKSGKISTSGFEFSLPPIGPFALGASYRRYWIDETENVQTNGSLYFPSSVTPGMDLDLKAFDVYDFNDAPSLFDEVPTDESLGGAFVDYDSYNVSAQGLSGGMRPYHYKSYLLRQTKKTGSEVRVRSYPLLANHKPSFRFIGDFSNRYLHDAGQDHFVQENINASDPFTNPFFAFDSNQTTGSGEAGDVGYIAAKNILPGSKSVEYFTNTQINDKAGNGSDAAINKGFIDCVANGFTRVSDSRIGGFKITNSSGVTYHYALPAYSYSEYSYSGKLDEQGKHQFNLYQRKEKYAYSWLLTAVTGPDYVDKNLNGYADNGDLGYWVVFNYGKWVGDYVWRNPSEGFNKDIDRNFNNFSKGKKEIYYLNTISTQSHTAIFVKEIRHDGKSVVPEIEEAIKTCGICHTVEDIDDGGFDPKEKMSSLGTYTDYPASTLKLNSIYLVENKEGIQSPPQAEVLYHSHGLASDQGKHALGNNVIDVYDVQVEPYFTNLTQKALKKIEFNTDYSLCPGTENSFTSVVDVYNTTEPPSSVREGKLTLQSLQIVGKNNARLIPPIKFDYDLDVSFAGFTTFKSISSDNPVTLAHCKVNDFENYEFKKGETVKFLSSGNLVYGYIWDISEQSGEIDIRPFSGSLSSSTDHSTTIFTKTKNPPYHKDFYDLWGLYKVDYNMSPEGDTPEDVLRMVTDYSAQSLDVWSLHSIGTITGAKINIEYEPDQYKTSLKKLSNISIKEIEVTSDGKTRFTLYESVDEFGLHVGDQIKFRFLNAIRYDVKSGIQQHFYCDDVPKEYVYKWVADDNNNGSLPIESINKNTFVLDYNIIDRFQAGTCIHKVYPYDFDDGGDYCIPIEYLDMSAPIFLGGEILFDNQYSSWGGGIRVKRVNLDNGNYVRSTLYEYQNGITTYEPLGFEIPIKKLTASKYNCLDLSENDEFDKYRDWYAYNVYQNYVNLFSNARELPGPEVFYEIVKVKEQIDRNGEIANFIGYSEYQFEVFSPNSIDINNHSSGQLFNQFNNPFSGVKNSTTPYSAIVEDVPVSGISLDNTTELQDFSSILGSLKRITLYDEDGHKITETVNHYLHDNFNPGSFKTELAGNFKNQGTIEETFSDARIIVEPGSSSNPSHSLFGLISRKIKYPSIQTSQSVTNYKTGITTETINSGFDFYSGEVTKTETTDGYGNTYITESFPAYRYYSEMGLAPAGGKNMLTQEAGKYVYMIDDENHKVGLVSASMQTWSDEVYVLDGFSVRTQPGIWRKLAMYSYVGNENDAVGQDGLLPIENDQLPEFTAWNKGDPETAGWQKNDELTLYDDNSHALEAIDLNGNYAATKMSADQTQVFATVANARYNEFTYSGAEETVGDGIFGGGVLQKDGVIDPSKFHTGASSLKLTAGKSGFEFYLTTSTELKNLQSTFTEESLFRASVWVHQNNAAKAQFYYTIDEDGLIGGPGSDPVYVSLIPDANKKAGEWYLFNIDIPMPVTAAPKNYVLKIGLRNTSVSSEDINVDDFRIHPLDAAMTSYVYNAWGELTHILDANNLYTEYHYDDMGRLIETFKETFDHGRVRTAAQDYRYAAEN